jgi:hypothetical protein
MSKIPSLRRCLHRSIQPSIYNSSPILSSTSSVPSSASFSTLSASSSSSSSSLHPFFSYHSNSAGLLLPSSRRNEKQRITQSSCKRKLHTTTVPYQNNAVTPTRFDVDNPEGTYISLRVLKTGEKIYWESNFSMFGFHLICVY